MVDEDTYCIDVLTQVASVSKALQSVAVNLLDVHFASLRCQCRLDRRPRRCRQNRRSHKTNPPTTRIVNGRPKDTQGSTLRWTTVGQLEAKSCIDTEPASSATTALVSEHSRSRRLFRRPDSELRADEDRQTCALARSVLADQADNLPGTDVEICAPEHRHSRRCGHIPRRYDFVMPCAMSPPTSPSGIGVAVDTVI